MVLVVVLVVVLAVVEAVEAAVVAEVVVVAWRLSETPRRFLVPSLFLV